MMNETYTIRMWHFLLSLVIVNNKIAFIKWNYKISTNEISMCREWYSSLCTLYTLATMIGTICLETSSFLLEYLNAIDVLQSDMLNTRFGFLLCICNPSWLVHCLIIYRIAWLYNGHRRNDWVFTCKSVCIKKNKIMLMNVVTRWYCPRQLLGTNCMPFTILFYKI